MFSKHLWKIIDSTVFQEGVEFELVKELNYLALDSSFTIKNNFKNISKIIQLNQTTLKTSGRKKHNSLRFQNFERWKPWVYSLYLNIFQPQKLPGFGWTY